MKTTEDEFVLKRKIAEVLNREKRLKIYLNSCLSTNGIQNVTPAAHTRSQSLESDTAKIESKFKNFQVLSPYKERMALFPDPEEQKLVKYRKALANWNKSDKKRVIKRNKKII